MSEGVDGCLQCQRPIPQLRKFCSQECYYRWRMGKSFWRVRYGPFSGLPCETHLRLPINHWHADHTRIMAELQSQRPSAPWRFRDGTAA